MKKVNSNTLKNKSFQRSDLATFLDFEIKLLYYIGFYPLSKPNFLFYLKKCLMYFSCLSYVFIMFVYIFQESSILKTIKTMYLCITEMCLCCKLMYFDFNASRIKEMQEFLSDPIFKNYEVCYEKVMKKSLMNFRKLGKTYRFFCIGCIFFYLLLPLLSPENPLPTNAWYPFDQEKYWLFIYAEQIISLAFSTYANSTMDLFVTGSMTVASFQFKLIGYKLLNLNDDGLNLSNLEKEEIIEEKLKNVIIHHEKSIM